MHGGEQMNKHYDINLIKQYVAGKLSVKEMHALERAALDDPFLQDALDGFENQLDHDLMPISLLQSRLEKRIAQERSQRDNFFFGRQRLAIGSVAAVLFILACVLFWMINYPIKQEPQNSMQEVSIQALPSVQATLKSGDLTPLIGWEDYNHYLSVYLQDIDSEESLFKNEVQATFKLLDGRPTSIQIDSDQVSPIEKEKIIQFIKEGPKWEGTEGVLTIQLKQ